jgi:hypothetical protein
MNFLEQVFRKVVISHHRIFMYTLERTTLKVYAWCGVSYYSVQVQGDGAPRTKPQYAEQCLTTQTEQEDMNMVILLLQWTLPD